MNGFRSYGRTKSPCFGCQEDRKEGMCHAECEKYIEFQKIHKKEVDVIKKNKNIDKNSHVAYMSDREFKLAGSSKRKNKVFKQTRK